MQALQEASHGPAFDYAASSPHLKHLRLRERLVDLLLDEIRAINAAGLPPLVLEVGAGHGGLTEPTLAVGCSVTATEMSRHSVNRLQARYGLNRHFRVIFDEDGALGPVGDERFSIVLCASVLHHIPDYFEFLAGPVLTRLAPGGSLVTVQDPLWYPGMPGTDLFASRMAYFAWRSTQGEYVEGLRTRIRRLRHTRDETNERDTVEYHVVRDGVDQDGILDLLRPRFGSVRLVKYWSTQGAAGQRAGELLKKKNTFAVIARSFRC